MGWKQEGERGNGRKMERKGRERREGERGAQVCDRPTGGLARPRGENISRGRRRAAGLGSPVRARRRFVQRAPAMEDGSGGFVVLVDCPAGLEVCVDCFSFTFSAPKEGVQGKNVFGVRDLHAANAELHLLAFGHSGGQGDAGQRQGLLFDLAGEGAAGGGRAFVWDAAAEALRPPAEARHLLPEGSEAALLSAAGDGRLRDRLAAYPAHLVGKWHNLTNALDGATLRRLSIRPMQLIRTDLDADGVDWAAARRAAAMEAEGVPRAQHPHVADAGLGDGALTQPDHVRRLRRRLRGGRAAAPRAAAARAWTDVEGGWMGPSGEALARMAPEEVSRVMMGGGEGLRRAAAALGWRSLVGEWQLSFLLAVWLLDAPALRQWQRLSNALLSARALPTDHSAVAVAVARIFTAMLSFLPSDALDAADDDGVPGAADDGADGAPQGGFLRAALGDFLGALEAAEAPAAAADAARRRPRALEAKLPRPGPEAPRRGGEGGEEVPIEWIAFRLEERRAAQRRRLGAVEAPERLEGLEPLGFDAETDPSSETGAGDGGGAAGGAGEGAGGPRERRRERMERLMEAYGPLGGDARAQLEEEGPQVVLPEDLASTVGHAAVEELLGSTVAWGL